MTTKFKKSSLLVAIVAVLLTFNPPSARAIVDTTKQYSVKDSLLKKEQLLKYCGEYLPSSMDTKMTLMSVVLYGDYIYRHVNNDFVRLNPVSAHKFIYDDDSKRSLDFVIGKDGKVTDVVVTRPDGSFTLKRNYSAISEPKIALAQSKPEQIDQLMNKYAEYGQFNGSVLVAEKGKIIYKKGFGMANMEWGIPNQPDTKHRLGSITKQFTSMLILQLVQGGKLKLEVPITTYLPDYPKEQGNKITLHHLLTHSSGIPNYTSFPDFFKNNATHPFTTAELTKLFADLPLEFTPGERFSYSNSGYIVIGQIIESVTGKSYEQVLQENIFTPLKMNSTGFDHHEMVLSKRASGYDKNGKQFTNAKYLDMSIPFAAGSLYSTVEDLYLWDQALYTDILLPTKSRDLLFGKYISAGSGHYGYGWSMYNIKSLATNTNLLITEHSGGIHGFNTIISRMPADKNLVVLLNNTSGAALGEMNYAIRAILYDRPYDMPKMSLAIALADVITKQGLATGLSKLKEFKNSGLYKMDEGELNALGYDFLLSGKVAEAIELFKINVEAFPASGNCYDSLGEAYLKHGDKELAIKNYKKSVDLDPQNENGKKVLAEISK